MSALQRIVFLALSLAISCEGKFYSESIARERLITDLFVNYESSSKPAPRGVRIDVNVNIVLQHFDFRETDGAFHFVGHLDASWKDPKLKWKPQDYNNLTRIPISQKIVWVPDLEVYNNAPDKFLRMHRNGIVVLSHDGTLLWSDVVDIRTFCTTNMRNWPHDSHSCKMSLGSWTYDALELDITSQNPNTTMTFDEIDLYSTEYRLTNFNATHVNTVYLCCVEPYTNIDYQIGFERRSAFVIIFRVCALTVVLLPLLALCMETQRSEKILLNGISFFIIILNLIYFASKVGRFSRGTPLIVVFFSCSLVLVTFCHLVSIFSLMTTRSRFQRNLHPRISKLLQSSVIRFIVPKHDVSSKEYRADINTQFEEVKLQEFRNLIGGDFAMNEWVILAKVIERVSALVVSLLYFILCTSCFV